MFATSLVKSMGEERDKNIEPIAKIRILLQTSIFSNVFLSINKEKHVSGRFLNCLTLLCRIAIALGSYWYYHIIC